MVYLGSVYQVTSCQVKYPSNRNTNEQLKTLKNFIFETWEKVSEITKLGNSLKMSKMGIQNANIQIDGVKVFSCGFLNFTSTYSVVDIILIITAFLCFYNVTR